MSMYQGDQSQDQVHKMIERDFLASSKMQIIDGNVVRIHRAMKDVALSKSPEQLELAAASIPPLQKSIDEDLVLVNESGSVPAAEIEAMRSALDAWQRLRSSTLQLMRDGKTEEAAERTRGQGAALAQSVLSTVAKVTKASHETARRRADETMSSIHTASLVMLAASATTIVLLLCCGFMVVRSMQRPMAEALALAEDVAAGRLRTRVEVPQGRDEFSRLLSALGQMNANLVEIIQRVRSGSDHIATGTTEIAAGNFDLSRRTEQQAANLQQTAASMEELSSAVRATAQTAGVANELAERASTAATKGGEMVNKVVGTMQDIAASSRKISDIIGVVDGIAFQTNILALNAAVEAARAGEQGRGFAVVASEVRNLAGRSAEAAREIKALIYTSLEKVDLGASIVDETGTFVSDIVISVQRVRQMVGEISRSAGEQADGLGQINVAVATLDHVTQQNAALVEENAAASQSLKSQASALSELVSLFKIETAIR